MLFHQRIQKYSLLRKTEIFALPTLKTEQHFKLASYADHLFYCKK